MGYQLGLWDTNGIASGKRLQFAAEKISIDFRSFLDVCKMVMG